MPRPWNGIVGGVSAVAAVTITHNFPGISADPWPRALAAGILTGLFAATVQFVAERWRARK